MEVRALCISRDGTLWGVRLAGRLGGGGCGLQVSEFIEESVREVCLHGLDAARVPLQ